MRTFITIAAAGILLTTPARADEFCDTLMRVVADAPANFVNVRGAPDTPDGHRYENPPALPGMEAFVPTIPPCWILPAVSHPGSYRYVCEFPWVKAGEKGQHGFDVFEHVVTCLQTADVEFEYPKPSPKSGGLRISTDAVDIEIGIEVLTHGAGMTNYLSITPKRA